MQKFYAGYRRFFHRPILVVVVLLMCCAGALGVMTSMPSAQPDRFETTAADIDLSRRLEGHVRQLAGPRNVFYPAEYRSAENYLVARLKSFGYAPTLQAVASFYGPANNVVVVIPGATSARWVVGAHYDSHDRNPGADDNASGTAALLEIARALHGTTPARTLELVFFANEEPPHFQTDTMGSVVHSKNAGEVELMISLEMLGYYSSEPNSQKYPPPLNHYYPDVGDFVAVVGSIPDRLPVQDLTKKLRSGGMKTYGFSGPRFIPGIGFSDHWSYWQHDTRAIMVTDTAFFRNDNYHKDTDLPETLDYLRMARVTRLVGEFVSQ
ncbi:MAG: M28 family peptidase [bacterium]